MSQSSFASEKVSRSATIILQGKIERVFPLFGAFEERKWAKGWEPTLIYPSTEVIEEGTTFKTKSHSHNENEYLWRVSKFYPKDFLIQYLVSTENRYWTITVKCAPASETTTSATITYSFIGLNALGNSLNRHALDSMYNENLLDWQAEINEYLSKTN